MKGLYLYTKFCTIFLLGYFSFVFLHINVFAIPGINETLSFQAKVTNIDGTNSLATCGNSCDFRFRIFDVAVGGTHVWQEVQSNISLYDGIVSVNLGSTNPFGSSVDWNNDSLYLEIGMNANTVAGDGPDSDGFEEVFNSPRIRLTAVPYAFNSKYLNGLSSDDFLKSNQSDSFEGENVKTLTIDSDLTSGDRNNPVLSIVQNNNGGVQYGNLVDISQLDTDSTGGVLGISNLGSGPSLRINDSVADTTPFLVDADGRVGIGTSNPTARLEIVKSSGSDDIVKVLNGVDNVITVENDGDINFHNKDIKNIRIENAGVQPTCDATVVGRQYYDTVNGAGFICIESSPATYTWFDFTTTVATTANKIVTVGTGGNYATISAAASYLNGITGGIILLTPETHTINSVVDLENITLIGANTTDTIINIVGGGVLDVKETQFKSLTLDIDATITSGFGLDVKYDPLTSSSVIFEWVDFDVNGTKVLVDSSEATAPIVRTRFISTKATNGNKYILNPKGLSNISLSSSHFVESQGGSGSLNMRDWDVEISGSGNIVTSGIVTTIPNDTIYIYPGMNIQAAINSLPSGGFITLLPGTHTITSTLLITTDSIQIAGYGDASVLSASGFIGGPTVAAIQIGAADGSDPSNDIVLKDFELDVSGTGASDIHGIRVTGGSDNQIYNLSVRKVSGTSGTGADAKMGIQFLDSVSGDLIRPVIQNSRVYGNGAGAYFTDGIHVTSDGSIAGVFGYGNRVINALVQSNNVDYVGETAAVFTGVDDSSLFNNRFSRMGVIGGGAYGLYIGNGQRINMTGNTVSGSLSTASIAVGIESFNVGSLKTITDSLFANNVIDGTANGGVGFGTGFQIGNTTNTEVSRNLFQLNTVSGASNAITTALTIRGNADDNIFSNNVISGGTNPWDTGYQVVNNTAERNMILVNKYSNVTVQVSDAGVGTLLSVARKESTTAPTVNDDIGDGYDRGTIWVDTTGDNIYVLADNTLGAAVWRQIAAGGGSADFESVYLTDADKILTVNNALGFEIANTNSGNISIDLQSTGDFVVQDNNSTFLTISDTGSFNYTLDATDNPGFTISNLGTSNSFVVEDQSTDSTPFVIDASGNVGIGTNAPSTNLHVVGGARITNLASCYRISTDANGNLVCSSGPSDLQQSIVYDTADTLTNIPTGGAQVTLGTVSVTPATATGDIYVSGFAEVRSSNNTDQPFNLVIETTNNCTGTVVGNANVTYTIAGNTSTTIHYGNIRVAGVAVDPGAAAQTYSLCARVVSGAGDTDVLNWSLEARVIDTGADLAELYTTLDNSLKAGNIVSLDDRLKTGVQKSGGLMDKNAIGIVATRPGVVIGEVDNEGVMAVPIALAGRVPVIIDTNSEDIQVGDYITTGVAPGTGQKATRPGVVVGRAIENWSKDSGKDSVMVFVGVETYHPNDGKIYTDLTPIATPVFDEFSGKYIGGINLGSENNFLNNVYTATLNAMTSKISNHNLSESFKTTDGEIGAGDVVSVYFDGETLIQKSLKSYDGSVVGVVSTNPGVNLSKWEDIETTRPVALAGSVPVKISTENGDVKIGDRLVAATTPGYAMKACGVKYCGPAMSIGFALEPFGKDSVGDSDMVLDKLSESRETIQEEISKLEDTLSNQKEIVEDLNNDKLIAEVSEQLEQIDAIGEVADALTSVDQDAQDGQGRIMMQVNLSYIGLFGNFVTDFDVHADSSLQSDSLGEFLQGRVEGNLENITIVIDENIHFGQDVRIDGHIGLGTDSSGQIVFEPNEDYKEIIFEDEYSSLPLIFIQSYDSDVDYKLLDVGVGGFKIQLKKQYEEEIVLNWLVFDSDIRLSGDKKYFDADDIESKNRKEEKEMSSDNNTSKELDVTMPIESEVVIEQETHLEDLINESGSNTPSDDGDATPEGSPNLIVE